MNRYRIKFHTEGYYTIQKRFLFIFWHEMRYLYGDYFYIKRWSQPPTEVLKEFEKYG